MNGKIKGSQFEREVCRKLTKWITGEEKPEIFWRARASGAKATIDHSRGIRGQKYGDIVSIDEKGDWFVDMFTIECKFYKDFNFLNLLQCRGKVLDWWRQVRGDASKASNSPLLIFTKNYRPEYLCIDKVADRIVDSYGGRPKNKLEYKEMNIYLFDEWLQFYDYETLKSQGY